MTDRLDDIKARAALRSRNGEDHSPIDVHETIDGVVVPETTLHQLCIECSDVDTIETLENNGLIDSADGVVFPCAPADVDWLIAEVERLRQYAETTKYHQDQHAAAVRELKPLKERVAEVLLVLDRFNTVPANDVIAETLIDNARNLLAGGAR